MKPNIKPQSQALSVAQAAAQTKTSKPKSGTSQGIAQAGTVYIRNKASE